MENGSVREDLAEGEQRNIAVVLEQLAVMPLKVLRCRGNVLDEGRLYAILNGLQNSFERSCKVNSGPKL